MNSSAKPLILWHELLTCELTLFLACYLARAGVGPKQYWIKAIPGRWVRLRPAVSGYTMAW